MAILSRLRDRFYSDPRFQRWAAAFPLTRGISRRNAAAIFDLTAGFVYSRVLEACLRLELLEALQRESQTAERLAPTIGLSTEACERLLVAAAGIELVERRGSRFGLGRLGAMVLGNPGLKSMVLHHRLFHRDLGDPVALLRREVGQTELNAFWSYADRSPDDPPGDGDEYSELMGSSVSMLIEDVLEAHPLGRHRHLLDVGGGDGSFLRAVAQHVPELELTLFDLPAVAQRARESTKGTAIRVVGGDLFHEPLPGGADCVSLIRILLDHDDGDALRILRAIRSQIAPGGALVIAEPMSDTGEPRVADTYFGLYLFAMGQGKTRSPAALGALLREAGFQTHRSVTVRRSVFCHLVIATA